VFRISEWVQTRDDILVRCVSYLTNTVFVLRESHRLKCVIFLKIILVSIAI